MADGAANLCVCVLFYGADDYCCQLARRVLNRPLRELAQGAVEFRFGFNAVSDDVRNIVNANIDAYFPCVSVSIDSPENIYKYPIMRRMLYDKPLEAPLLMWFDDNSFIDPETDVGVWYDRITAQMQHCAMIGSVYTQGLSGNQAAWIKDQPWFAGKTPGPYIKYAAGGWWTMQTDVLRKFDWPSADTKQHGGDVMLGELLRQQDLRLCHFRDNVNIQANASGVESVSMRRGFDAPPVGFSYVANES